MNVVELARELIRTPGLSGQESAVAALVQERMKQLGFTDIEVDECGSVVGFVGPRHADIALLFDAHMDVVPAAGNWTVDPFGGEVRGDRLYGRGAVDMKGALAAALCGVARAAADGGLTRRIAVSASVLEEQVEGFALSRILDRHAPRAVVICEPSKLALMTGQKGRLEILLTLPGQPAHAALPEAGRNAIDAIGPALAALAAMPLPSHGELGDAILVATDIVSTPYPSISQLPSQVTLRFDRRTLPGERAHDILAAMNSALAGAGLGEARLAVADGRIDTYTGRTFSPARDLPAWMMQPDQPLVHAAKAAIRAAGAPLRTGVWKFCTNGSESAGRRGIPTIGLGPGSEEAAHTADESIAIGELDMAAAIYERLCRPEA